MTEDELIAVVFSRMEELGWNQTDLAYRAGTSPAQVSRLLRRVHEGRLGLWIDLFNTLGLDLELMKREGREIKIARPHSAVAGGKES